MSVIAHYLANSGLAPLVRVFAPARRASAGAVGLLTAALAGCVTPPADYALALSQQDPKWHSPQCARMRAEASTYEAGEKKPLSWSTGLLLGPYGLGIAAASKEHQEKQRKQFVREMHLRCSSQPLPKELQFDPTSMGANPT